MGWCGLPKKSKYLKVAEAAAYLGIDPKMLLDWEERGIIKSVRHPVTRHRLYEKSYLKENFNNFSVFASVEENNEVY